MLSRHELLGTGLVRFVSEVLAAGQAGFLGEQRGLFARAVLLVVAEQGLWDAVPGDGRVHLEAWVQA